MNKEKIAEKILRYKKVNYLTLDELVENLNINKTTLSNLCNCKTDSLSFKTTKKLLKKIKSLKASDFHEKKGD